MSTLELTREDYHKTLLAKMFGCSNIMFENIEDYTIFCLNNGLDINCIGGIIDKDINQFRQDLRLRIFNCILNGFSEVIYWMTEEEQIDKMSDLGFDLSSEQVSMLSDFIKRDKLLIPATLDKKFDIIFDYQATPEDLKNNLLTEVANIMFGKYKD
jgi:hypothetical protein